MTYDTVDVIPEQLRDLVKALIEGRVKSLITIAELSAPDGDEVTSQCCMNIDDHRSNLFVILGALEAAKHGFLHQNMNSHIAPDEQEGEDE